MQLVRTSLCTAPLRWDCDSVTASSGLTLYLTIPPQKPAGLVSIRIQVVATTLRTGKEDLQAEIDVFAMVLEEAIFSIFSRVMQ